MVSRLDIWRSVDLVHLDVSFTGIGDGALGSLVRQCPNLLKVNLCGCQVLTNSALFELVRSCKKVQVHFDGSFAGAGRPLRAGGGCTS